MQQVLVFDNNGASNQLFGVSNGNLQLISSLAHVSIESRGNELTLTGPTDKVRFVAGVLNELMELIEQGRSLDEATIRQAMRLGEEVKPEEIRKVHGDRIVLPSSKISIHPKSANQREYLQRIQRDEMVFGIGPAGTGKTYLAMAMAVWFLMKKKVKRIVLTRPAVEAGERLGFLPGDLAEKVNPYLRPLYDALHDMVDFEKASFWMSQGIVEVAPLAFMRGRTLNDSFIILDEAQNTTKEQMKMFLTRMGFGSRVVVTGDITQVDLPRDRPSGLVEVMRILDGIDGIAFCRFNKGDVVRHPLVQNIVMAYEKDEESASSGKA